jgi:hypothetical protein
MDHRVKPGDDDFNWYEGHCEEPTGPAFGRPDDKFRDQAIHLSSAANPACARVSYPSNTASAPFTASALSITVRSSEPACTEMFSAKNRASVT